MDQEAFVKLPLLRRMVLMHSYLPVFFNCLKNAGLKIKQDHFKQKYAGENGEAAENESEYNYCYDFYRHLQNELDAVDLSPFILNPGVNKAKNPNFKGHYRLDGVIPDFCMHTPGKMEGNFVVIEVKPLIKVSYPKNQKNREELEDDLEKLTAFRDHKIQYVRAVHLVYGSTVDRLNQYGIICKELAEKAKKEARAPEGKSLIDLNRIMLLWQEKPESKIQHILWERLIK